MIPYIKISLQELTDQVVDEGYEFFAIRRVNFLEEPVIEWVGRDDELPDELMGNYIALIKVEQ